MVPGASSTGAQGTAGCLQGPRIELRAKAGLARMLLLWSGALVEKVDTCKACTASAFLLSILLRCCLLCDVAVQIPLIPLPLPNVTIYFTIWRIISNRSAGKGVLV